MTMRGFDPEFTDIVDYILRITYRIWEGKQTALCLDYYSADCPVYTIAGLTVGAQEVMDNTDNTLAAFPDRTLLADAIICGGDDEQGFHTSHLIHTEMTNLGDSDLGPPTGKHAAIKVIAHCIIKNNIIIEEWLVRDNYSLVEQLGLDPQIVANQKAQDVPQARFSDWRKGELARVSNNVNTEPLACDLDVAGNEELYIRCTLHNIWNAGLVDQVHKAYATDAKVHASANRDYYGPEEIEQFYIQFRDTLSDLKVSVDYVCQQQYRIQKNDTHEGLHVAVRWTMIGQHTGTVLFGEPSHAPVLILGESHYHFIDGKIHEEWTVFDELAILTQIYRARLTAPKHDAQP